MEEKYLSDVIDYERDIEPFRFIFINAGVGAGKNTWAESLFNELKKNVLFITSRAITADVFATKVNAQRWKMNNDVDLSFIGKQNKVVATNSAIEGYVKRIYKPGEKETYLWNYFDLIVLDEAHSLVTDSTFSDAPFHVKRFIKWVYENRTEHECKVIMMTGTENPVWDLFSDKLCESDEFNYLDLFQLCVHLEPECVQLFPVQTVHHEIASFLNEGKRMVYFVNSIGQMESMVKKLLDLGVQEETIGISYSEKKEREFPNSLLEKMGRIREYIIEYERLPPDINLFLTTCQNQEGISLHDDDISFLIIESHDFVAIKQEIGRIRKGGVHVVVLYDAAQHSPIITEDEIEFDRQYLKYINTYWDNYQWDERQLQIDLIEKKFPCVKYDYLTDRFWFYSERKKAFERIKDNEQTISRCVRKWEEQVTIYTNNDTEYIGESVRYGEYLFQLEFPYSDVVCSRIETPARQMAYLQKEFNEFVAENNLLSGKYDIEEKTGIEELLRNFFVERSAWYCYNFKQININIDAKRINTLLNLVGYSLKAISHKKNSKYILTKTNCR